MVLGLDSASSACSVAVVRNGTVLAERFRPMARGHVEALMPMVLAALDEAATGFAALDLIAVTVGPGSFTGLRAGLAAARGMAFGGSLPLDGVTTLEAVAFATRGESAGRPVLVALETRRDDLYVQRFDPDGAPETEPAALPPSAALVLACGALLAGDGAGRLGAESAGRPLAIAAGPGLPAARDVAAIAAARRQSGRRPLAPAPFYLHPPEARIAPSAPGAAR